MEVAVSDERAKAVLDQVDELWGEIQRSMARLCCLLVEAKRGEYWTRRGFKTEEEWVRSSFPQSRSQYYNLVRIGEHLSPLLSDGTVEQIGRTNAEQLVRIKLHLGELPDEWVQAAQQDGVVEFRDKVRRFFSEQETTREQQGKLDKSDFISFRMFDEQRDVVHDALRAASRETGSESMAYNLYCICMDFISGHADDGSGRLAEMGNQYRLALAEAQYDHCDWSDPDLPDQIVMGVTRVMERHKIDLTVSEANPPAGAEGPVAEPTGEDPPA